VDNSDQSALAGALDILWTRFLPEMDGRIAALEAAAEACRSNCLSVEQREDAHGAAHKLAGVLGTFGLSRGTMLARELEAMYSQPFGSDASQTERLSAMAAELRTIVASRK
jgi:HPt (histidine-containing phosphotransfer) domain-containing protein